MRLLSATLIGALSLGRIGGCQPRGAAPEPTASAPAERVDRRADAAPASPRSASPTCPPEMIHVPGGTLRMGDDSGEPEERPAHVVVVAPFCVDRTEVTAAAYQSCVDGGGCSVPGPVTVTSDAPLCNLGRAERAMHPMNCVDRAEASQFCARRGARLPTEAEWELAARGEDGRPYPWGSASPVGRACIGAETCPVGSFSRQGTPLGVVDLAGNVRELTASLLCPYAPADAPCLPWGDHASRGGSFRSAPRDLRAAARVGDAYGERAASLGFRCVVGPALPPPRPQPEPVRRMCECFKQLYQRDECVGPETQLIGGADPDCVRTWARDCSMMIACSRGEPGAAPKCLPGHKPWGAMRSCAKACRKDADCATGEECSKEWGDVCVTR